MKISKKIQDLNSALILLRKTDKKGTKLLTNFKSQQNSALHATVENSILAIEKELFSQGINVSKQINSFKSAKSIEEKQAILEEISELVAQIPEQKDHMGIPQITFPTEVRDEMNADLEELKRCFDATCYRSVVVLCGRLLETALHRIHFEIGGQDLLEKSPGMGLGNLIARIEEKGIKLDPGLTNQIHLINQVRIYSVHKKQQPFYPSKTQAHAIILYTTDVLKKLFKNK